MAKALKKNEPQAWGYHLIMNLEGCDENIINSGDLLKAFILAMVDKLKMIPVGEPVVRYFNDGDGRGTSIMQLITTSTFMAHTDDKEMSAYIDIFSCSKYNPDDAISLIKEHFNPKSYKKLFILRDPDRMRIINE